MAVETTTTARITSWLTGGGIAPTIRTVRLTRGLETEAYLNSWGRDRKHFRVASAGEVTECLCEKVRRDFLKGYYI